MTNFTHLHLHTTYSFLDGYNPPKRAVAKAKELGMTHLAITDHNSLCGIVEFQSECLKEGITPILGIEGYWTWDTNILRLPKEERDAIALEKAKKAGITIGAKAKKKDIKETIAPFEYDTKQYHIILLAINQTGWKNLIRLQSESASKCTFNGRYLCDDEMLEKYNEGLIFATACIGNVVPTLINQDKIEEAEQQILKWKNIFGDRMYIEIQPLNIAEQRTANVNLINIAEKHNIPVIATNDVHYTNYADHDDHDTLLCIGTGAKKSDTNRLRYSNDFWMKSYDEMIKTFRIQAESIKEDLGEIFDIEDYMGKIETALENTNKIANMVESIKLGSDTPILPHVNVPSYTTPEGYFTMLSFRGLYKYYAEHPEIDIKKYERRLSEELDVINSKGYAPYMLIVRDYIEFCDKNDIPVGPGRGSAGGSLALFVNNMTKVVDPIKYGLLFFRFLTKDRTALPDIDTDFSWAHRGDVIKYLKQKYGEDCVSHIGTYSEMGVKSGLKDVGRVLDIPFSTMNEISKNIDNWFDRPDLKFEHIDSLATSDLEADQEKYKQFKECENQYPELFRLARAFEGTPRNMGIHASGILVTPTPVRDYVPIRVDNNGTAVALFTGVQLEELGLVKFDILGLKTLDVLDKALKHINKDLTVLDLYKTIQDHTSDKNIFSMIKNKQTEGLFQIESNMFKGLVENILPDSLEDITAITSIGRPGPLSAGMHVTYAKRKSGAEKIKEPLKNTMDIVKDTFGTIIYQESIMEIAMRVAKVDANQADSLYRKAIAKKKQDLMEICRRIFVYGKINAEDPDPSNTNAPYYDVTGKYGPEVPGGINNGYDEKELSDFFESLKGYADYLFNKSHACAYSVITLCTAYLKHYYPAEFFAALLTMQDKEEKIDMYTKVASAAGITVKTPDINRSDIDFKPMGKEILFGIGSIKGVGDSSIKDIIENRPYKDLADAIERLPKKAFNKRVAIALIKSGAFDEVDTNRNELINLFYAIRKDKDEPLDINGYTREVCMMYEKETLGTSITHKPMWDDIKVNENISINVILKSIAEKADKHGRTMAFAKCIIDGSEVNAVIFASTYNKIKNSIKNSIGDEILLLGKKDDKGNLIVDGIDEDTNYNYRLDFMFDLA